MTEKKPPIGIRMSGRSSLTIKGDGIQTPGKIPILVSEGSSATIIDEGKTPTPVYFESSEHCEICAPQGLRLERHRCRQHLAL